MSGPVGPIATATCPSGHTSLDPYVCSVCGARIPPGTSSGDSTPTVNRGVLPVPGPDSAASPLRPLDADHHGSAPTGPSRAPGGAGPSPTGGSPPGASATGGSAGGASAGGRPATGEDWMCPNCSAELDAGARFCEVCGYDPTTGSLPHAQAPVVRPATDPRAASPTTSGAPSGPASLGGPPGGRAGPARLRAIITADRAYYDSHGASEVQFPVGVPPRTIDLSSAPATIGRRSRSRGTDPAIDLAGPPEDPAVSHTHASLLPADDGTWQLVDHGSTNGTYLNESPEALPANRPMRVGPGDRIYVGAWTLITLDVPPPA